MQTKHIIKNFFPHAFSDFESENFVNNKFNNHAKITLPNILQKKTKINIYFKFNFLPLFYI